MPTLSVRFPDDLERKLAAEARLAHKGRSELVREAVQEYVVRRERERFMRDMIHEMKEWLGDHTARADSRELMAELPEDDMDAVLRSETDSGANPGGRWWE